MKKQVHVFYSGRVQGVGFRYTAREFAEELDVTGWAKNLFNGKVEVVAEAPEEVLKVFLEKISQYFRSYIKNREETWLTATGEFKEFSIRF